MRGKNRKASIRETSDLQQERFLPPKGNLFCVYRLLTEIYPANGIISCTFMQDLRKLPFQENIYKAFVKTKRVIEGYAI